MLALIPPEIVETIIDSIATNAASLKACSLVCQEFLPLCRKHIFGTIVIHGFSTCTTAMLQRLLMHSPHLAQYIRNLTYFVQLNEFSNPPVAEVFLHLTRLLSLSVVALIGEQICVWTSPPFRRIMLPLLHLPTLTHLYMDGIHRFDVADLIPCVNLKKLDIREFGPVEQGHGSAPNAKLDFPLICPAKQLQLEGLTIGTGGFAAATRLCTARRPDGEPIVDLSSLKSLSVTYDRGGGVSDSRELFRRCNDLTAIKISGFQPGLSGFGAMVEPSKHTLREIEVRIAIGFNHEYPSPAIADEFEELANHKPNYVQSICLHVCIPAHFSGQPGIRDQWGLLDAALTRASWSHLRRVRVLIFLLRRCMGVQSSDSSMEAVLTEVRNTQFKQLSVSERVHLPFEVDSAD